LLRAYREEIDLHALTASSVFNVAIDKVTPEQRAIGKMSNFNLAFEGGPTRIQEAAGISETMSQRVYDRWHRTYPGVKRWGKAIKEFCWEHGYVESLYGRRRRLPEIHSTNMKLRSYAERQAVNHPIQGSAADVAKAAIVLIYRALDGKPAHLILQVHDEFVVECPEDFAEEGLLLVRQAMESVMRNGKPVLQVPLVADVHMGKTWSEAK
jgi:DNA polymerase-1